MKKLIFTLSLIFSLLMSSLSVFAADYTISEAYWDVGDRAYAGWDEPEDKTRYKVQLFKGNKKVSSAISTGAERYDFTKLIVENGAGSYSFKVYSTKLGSSRAVTSSSEYFDSETISDLKKRTNTSTSNSSNSSGSSTSSSTSSTGSSSSTGWYQTGSNWHYRKPDGYGATGWQLVNNLWYFFDANGNMQTGWVDNNNNRYYLNPTNGDMTTGWVQISDKWYYLNADGTMATGWTPVNDKWYFLSSDGVMNTGWVQRDNKWLYLSSDGSMVTGWVEDNGRWYYFNPQNGEMLTDTVIDGYTINADGVRV